MSGVPQYQTSAEGTPVGLPPLVQRPEVPIRTRLGLRSLVMLFVVRPSWLWRREITTCLALGLASAVTGLVASWLAAVFAPLAVVAAVVLVPVLRRWAVRTWRRARLRRQWDAACRYARLTTHNDRIPRIRHDAVAPAGDRLKVRMPKGSTVGELEAGADVIAACLRVREVRVLQDARRADIGHVDIVRRDPFQEAGPGGLAGELGWPLVMEPQLRLWDRHPVAVDDMGDPVWLRLVGKNMLLGGEPGAGKSAALSLLLAVAALDPWARIWGMDAKRLELALWKPVIDQCVFNSIDDAIDMTGALIQIMDGRYEELEQSGRRDMTPADGDLYVLAIDELRYFTAHPDRKKRAVLTDQLIDIKSRGRAAGIIGLEATQRPSTDVVPSSLRDLSAYRWAMRCNTRDASDTILGAGTATQGWTASDIDPDTRGVGLLRAEGGQPITCKSYYLSDADIRAIAARGAALRASLL